MPTTDDRPSWVPPELYPFEDHYLDAAGSKIHYIDEGSGPTILFLHGNPTWSFLYRNIIKELKDSFRCVALDYPGFGLSTPAEGYGYTAAEHSGAVERVMVELDLRDVTLVAQDWGGPIGLSVATRHSDRFSGFVLGNTWAWPLNNIFHFEMFSRVMSSPPARALIRSANAFVNVMVPLGSASKIPDEVMDAYRGPFSSPESRKPTGDFARQLLASEPFMQSLEKGIHRISHLPTLFLWGGGDFALRKRVELPRFQKVLPNHKTVVLEKARHFWQEDAPNEAAREIRTWFVERAS